MADTQLDANIVKIPIDMDGKSILVLDDFTGDQNDVQEFTKKLQDWMVATNEPVFIIITRGDMKLHLHKIGGKRGKRSKKVS
jgi:hypothetical protein